MQAPLVWLAVLSHTPWDGAERPTWASNETLSNETGLPVRDVENGISILRSSGMLTTYDGHRPGARRPWGRVLVPHIDAPVRVLMPTTEEMSALWDAGFKIRERPAALVTLMVGMFVIASHARGRSPTRWTPVPGPKARIDRLVGASHGRPVAKRFDDLESAGLISRTSGLAIAPPSKWVVRAPEPVRPKSAPTEWHHDEGAAMTMDHDPRWELDPSWT